MLKRLLQLILILCVPVILYSQNNNTIYTDVEPSIVYLQHEVYLNPDYCENKALFTRLERQADIKILGESLPLVTGTGFIIDSDGTIITNNHVVQIPSLDQIRNIIADEIPKSISQVSNSNILSHDMNSFLSDLKRMVQKGELQFTARLGDEVYRNIDVLFTADENDPDIAVIKINDEKQFQALKFADAGMINKNLIGNDVYSFGYPLGVMIGQLFEDNVVTMNKGYVSAYRNAELNIQHSAAISHGNSGGPLIDDKGTVLGINTAGLQEQQGNSLYYAIGADQIQIFLNKNGFGDILKWNAMIIPGQAMNQGVVVNVLGEIETSSDLIIDTEKGAEVFLNGVLVGESPLFINLDQSLTDLEIKGETGDFSGKLRLLSSLKGTTTIKPFLKTKPSKLLVNSEYRGVEVFANGKKLGITPLNVSIPPGKYKLNFSLPEGYLPVMVFKPLNIVVNIHSQKEIFITGRKAHWLYIVGLTEYKDDDAVKFILKNDDFEITKKSRDFYISEGSWILKVEGIPELEGEEIFFEKVNGISSLNLNKYLPSSELTIRNMPQDAKILIDNKPYNNSEIKPLLVPVGKRNVIVWKKGSQPFETTVMVKKEGSAYITYQEKWSNGKSAKIYTAASLLSGLAGAVVLGIYKDQWTNEYALENSNNYDEYLQIRESGDNALKVGTGLLVTSCILAIPAIIKWSKYSQEKRKIKSMRWE